MSQPIFPEICRQVARAVGENILIPSPSLLESNRIRLLSIVIMTTKRRWIWFTTVDYEPRLISLEDVLIDKSKLKLKIKALKIDSYELTNTGTMLLKSIFGGGSCSATVDANLGELLLQEIEDASFIAELKDRRIDMRNTLIDQIKKTEEVLCVVKCVLNTSDKVVITHTGNRVVNIKLPKKIRGTIDAESEASTINVRDMVRDMPMKIKIKDDSSNAMTINTENTLAFHLCQLIVDENSGEITPVMREGNSGGYFKKDKEGKESKPQSSLDSSRGCDGGQSRPYDKEVKESKPQSSLDSSRGCDGGQSRPYDEVQEKSKSRSSFVYSAFLGGFSSDMDKSCAHEKGFSTIDPVKEKLKALTNLQEKLKPLRAYTEADGPPIKSLLLRLMTCSSDVVALSKILPKAENGCLNEDENTLDRQFIKRDTVWSILKFVGVKNKAGRVLYERKAAPLLIAVAYMIDAILEIENDDLDTIYHCNKPQLKTLSNIFESAVVSSDTIPVNLDTSSDLNESVTSFLTRLKFTVCSDSIEPPKTKTGVAECIFCVLYCLSS